MKNIIRSLTFFVFTCLIGHADVYNGTFEWGRDGATDFSMASFTFDTSTNLGEITGLIPNQGAYVTMGSWNFTIGIVDTNLHGDKVIIDSFESLTDFSHRSLMVMPELGFGGPPAPYETEGQIYWDLYAGNASGSVTDGYSITDGSMFNAYYEDGVTGNFTQIPEPENAALVFGSMAILFLILKKRRGAGGRHA